MRHKERELRETVDCVYIESEYEQKTKFFVSECERESRFKKCTEVHLNFSFCVFFLCLHVL